MTHGRCPLHGVRTMNLPLSSTQAAKAAGVSRWTVVRALKSGELRGFLDNKGQWRITPEELAAWRSAPDAPDAPRAHAVQEVQPAPLDAPGAPAAPVDADLRAEVETLRRNVEWLQREVLAERGRANAEAQRADAETKRADTEAKRANREAETVDDLRRQRDQAGEREEIPHVVEQAPSGRLRDLLTRFRRAT